MGQVIQFISKSERERIRLIQEARAIYDSIFPSADPAGEQQEATISRARQQRVRQSGVIKIIAVLCSLCLSGKLPRADRHHARTSPTSRCSPA